MVETGESDLAARLHTSGSLGFMTLAGSWVDTGVLDHLVEIVSLAVPS